MNCKQLFLQSSARQPLLSSSTEISTLPKAYPPNKNLPNYNSLKTSHSSVDPSDGTNVDEEEIVPRSKPRPVVPKKPAIKRVSFNDEHKWKDNDTDEDINHTNYRRINTNASDKLTSTAPTNPIYSTVLKANSSFISDQSDIHIPNSDIIIPPPPPFMTEKNTLIDIQSVPLPPLPPTNEPDDELPPINLSTLPSRSSSKRAEFFEIVEVVNHVDFNKNNEFKPKSPSPLIPHSYLTPMVVSSADKIILPVENEPELIQVHLSNLPSVSHHPNVPCSLHPDITSPIITQNQASMHSSMTYPPLNQPYMPLSTVSGSYNPFIVKDNTMMKTLPSEPSFTNYHTIYKTSSASAQPLSTPLYVSPNTYTDKTHTFSKPLSLSNQLKKSTISQPPIEKSPITPSNKISGGSVSMFGDVVERGKSTIDEV